MKLKTLGYVIPLLSLFAGAFAMFSGQALAMKSKSGTTLALPTCSVNITADSVVSTEDRVTYSGNVTVLVGFASLRSDKVTLVKKSDGSCELISE